jgi:hypothetical protein
MICDSSSDNGSSMLQNESLDARMVTTRSKRGTFPQLRKNLFPNANGTTSFRRLI